MPNTSVALVSGPVGKNPQALHYSFVFDEAFRLAKRGSDVHIVRNFQEEDSFSNGIHFHGLGNVSRIKYIPFMFKHLNVIPNIGYFVPPWELLHLAKYASASANVVTSQNVDLIHAHFAYPEGLVGLLAKKETKKPLVVTVHGYDILVESSIGYGVRLSRRIDSLVRKVLNDADAVIAASKATFVETKKIVGSVDKVYLIPNGVDVEKFNPHLEYSIIRKKLNIEGKTVIFALRNHEPKNGLEYLIRAASIVIQNKKDVVFVVGGDGSLKCFHEQLATKLGLEGKMLFTGRIQQSEVPYYYAASDIVVIPSIQEAFGLVATEAMACGKPVIGTNVGGLPDQIINGYNGFLVPPANPSDLAERILWLINNPKEAADMGKNGRKLAEKKFDLRNRINRIMTLYESILTA